MQPPHKDTLEMHKRHLEILNLYIQPSGINLHYEVLQENVM